VNGGPRSATIPDSVRILRERARVLARAIERPRAADAVLEVLEFRLADEHYAIETRFVREVRPLKDLTPLPCVPPFVRGIVNVRGRILPVLDLKRLFDLPEQGLADLHHVIVLEDDDLSVGLLADAAVEVVSIEVAGIQPALPTLGGIRGEYLRGVTAEQLVVLDAARILRDPRLVVRDDVDVSAP